MTDTPSTSALHVKLELTCWRGVWCAAMEEYFDTESQFEQVTFEIVELPPKRGLSHRQQHYLFTITNILQVL